MNEKIKALQDVGTLCSVLFDSCDNIAYRRALLDVKRAIHLMISDEILNEVPKKEAYSARRRANIIVEVMKDDK